MRNNAGNLSRAVRGHNSGRSSSCQSAIKFAAKFSRCRESIFDFLHPAYFCDSVYSCQFVALLSAYLLLQRDGLNKELAETNQNLQTANNSLTELNTHLQKSDEFQAPRRAGSGRYIGLKSTMLRISASFSMINICFFKRLVFNKGKRFK